MDHVTFCELSMNKILNYCKLITIIVFVLPLTEINTRDVYIFIFAGSLSPRKKEATWANKGMDLYLDQQGKVFSTLSHLYTLFQSPSYS